ncbi:hypothetical protein BaRGS_00017252 [Batillaria attramentaria]|uniref:Dual specificity protein phosphatase n=1 Tax=Batillaria attramentaria TaxID=370345 RepID=A0ABD0KVU7_9CAEN
MAADAETPCTIEELDNIITASTGGLTVLPNTPYDEIIPGLFIGEGDAARQVISMRDLGVTHIVNAALGKSPYHVNTNHVMYRRHNIAFMGIEATDFMNFDLTPFFRPAADFIEEGLEKGKVMVHCVQGVSRSATLVIAYFMLKHYMRVQTATRLVRKGREICPNPGFLQQLCHFDEALKKAGHFQGKPAD